MRENPVISDWAPCSGGCTEGLLGGWLAQRQAALRGMVAAGALSTFTSGRPCVPVSFRAPRVPQNVLWKDGGIGPWESKIKGQVEVAAGPFESFANFYEEKVPFASNNAYTRVTRYGRTITRSCTP